MSEDKNFRNYLFIGGIAAIVGIAVISTAFDGGPSSSRSISFGSGDHHREKSSQSISQTRSLADFSRIDIRSAVELRVENGDFNVVVETGENFIDQVITRVEDDVLIIEFDEQTKHKSWDLDDMRVEISMPHFKGLSVSGAVEGRINGIDSAEVDVEIGGAADLDLRGTCGRLILVVAGAGNIDADHLECEEADVSVAGAGNAEVYASKRVNVSVAGIGNVEVSGNPEIVEKSVGGLGSIDID